jgi:glycosyltransferase involved in cell wall biosynthesis
LAACDVFCMPSMSEILPTVYLEAWSMGKPVIGGLAHGLRELVEGNAAGLTVGQDPAQVADAVVRLLTDAALRERFGAAGQALVARKYSVAAVTSALVELYRQLLSEKSARPLADPLSPSPVSAFS